MATYNHENIIVGAADVYVETAAAAASTTPTAWPALTAATTAAAVATAYDDATGFRSVGLTSGGVEFAYAPDFGEVEVDQYLDVAKMFKQRQSVTVSTTFAEATLENLLFAWGQSDETYDGTTRVLTISAGNLGDKPEERKLAFIGPAPDDAVVRVYQLERVLSVESSSHSLSRAEATLIPVSLRCLPIQGATGNEYGRIIEVDAT